MVLSCTRITTASHPDHFQLLCGIIPAWQVGAGYCRSSGVDVQTQKRRNIHNSWIIVPLLRLYTRCCCVTKRVGSCGCAKVYQSRVAIAQLYLLPSTVRWDTGWQGVKLDMESEFLCLALDIIGLGVFNYDFVCDDRVASSRPSTAACAKLCSPLHLPSSFLKAHALHIRRCCIISENPANIL
jgi:hypothetical protein